MARETTFWIGGVLTIVLGPVFAGLLVWAGAGVDFYSAYLGVALALVLGSFFLYVAGAESRARTASNGGAESTRYDYPPKAHPPPP
jgi:hypothetical protein